MNNSNETVEFCGDSHKCRFTVSQRTHLGELTIHNLFKKEHNSHHYCNNYNFLCRYVDGLWTFCVGKTQCFCNLGLPNATLMEYECNINKCSKFIISDFVFYIILKYAPLWLTCFRLFEVQHFLCNHDRFNFIPGTLLRLVSAIDKGD